MVSHQPYVCCYHDELDIFVTQNGHTVTVKYTPGCYVLWWVQGYDYCISLIPIVLFVLTVCVLLQSSRILTIHNSAIMEILNNFP